MSAFRAESGAPPSLELFQIVDLPGGMMGAVKVFVEKPKNGRLSSGIVVRPGRLLIIDDEPYVADAMKLLLSDDHDVTVETTAEAALNRLVAGERFDMVLCDIMMPKMDGMELHRRLTQLLPVEAERLVFMTGGVFLERIRAFLDSVPNLVIEKPLDLPALRALILERIRDGKPASMPRAG